MPWRPGVWGGHQGLAGVIRCLLGTGEAEPSAWHPAPQVPAPARLASHWKTQPYLDTQMPAF